MQEVSSKTNIFLLIFIWQFFDAPKSILKAWGNFLRFYLNYFSIFLLIKTLFSPWHRYRWAYPRGLDIWKYLEVFLSNLTSRFLGAILRIILIFVGLLVEIFIVLAGFIVLLGWILLPLLLIFGIRHGFRILF